MLWKKGKNILGESIIEIKRSHFNFFIYILSFILLTAFYLSFNSFFDLKYIRKTRGTIEKEISNLNENINYLEKELENINK